MHAFWVSSARTSRYILSFHTANGDMTMRKLWNTRKGGKSTFRMLELGSVTKTTKGQDMYMYNDGGDPPFSKDWFWG